MSKQVMSQTCVVRYSALSTQNGNETNPEIKKNNQSRYSWFPRNCCHLLLRSNRVFLLQWRKITFFFFFLRRGRTKKKTSEKNAGDNGEIATDIWSKSYRRLLLLSWCFPSVFAGNACDSYGRIKADDKGPLTSTILINFQFDVAGVPTVPLPYP